MNRMINRKLNTTPVLISELRIGNILRTSKSVIGRYVITAIDFNLSTVQLEYSGFDFSATNRGGWRNEVYDIHTESISRIQGLPLWNFDNNLNDHELKEFAFISNPGHEYSMIIDDFTISIKDLFGLDECALLTVRDGGQVVFERKIWYVHELQNGVYAATGQDLQHPMLKKVLIPKSLQTTK